MTERRDYTPADADALLRFTQRIWTPDSRWHLGDIAWEFASGLVADPRMALWEHAGTVVAWGWFAPPDRVALMADPASVDPLVHEVVDWAAGLAGEPVSVGILDTEKPLAAVLRRRGLRPDPTGRFFVNMQRDLADLPPVPAGVTVRPVAGADLPARAALHRAVWGDGHSDEAFAAMAARWPYRARFDLVAVDPDGSFTSYILGWYDEKNRCGEFEPVGTLESHRRRGLSRAVGIALLHAFRAAGADRALVYARGDDEYPIPRQVYADLGFRPHGRIVMWRPPGTAATAG